MKKPHALELARHGYDLFPVKVVGKKKLPLYKGWQTAPALKEFGRHEYLGVRLKSSQLVIDVDPRNGGSLEMLWGIDPVLTSRCPRVETMSGGWHVYLTMPDGWGKKLRHTLKEFPGIEFKTVGRFVVAPGSPGYDWDLATPKLPAPVVPDSILTLVAVELAAGGASSNDEGGWSPGELATALAQLDASEFREHDDWFALMAACHEATGGEGLDEFVAWSTSDPEYAGHEGRIAGRWASFVAGRDGNAGAGTLVKVLLDHGAEVPGSVSARSAASDFDELRGEATDPLGDGLGVRDKSRPPSLMATMSEEFKAVDDNGKFRVYARRPDHVLGRDHWIKYDKVNFLHTCEAVLHLPEVQCGSSAKGDAKYEPAGEHWMRCYRKKETYRGVVYMPEHDGDKTPDGRMNIWKGFAVEESSAGTWNLLKEVMLETLCSWDSESYEYVMNWMARAVQRPWETGGVAVVFKGKKGTGKSTLGSYLCRLFGRHGMQVTSPSLLTGRFNAHLRDISMLFGDEAFWAGDKAGEGVLKGLITEGRITYEGKGENAESGRNCVHLMNASNESWVVPAGLDGERRFAVFEVGTETRDNGYWGRLRAEMENGGMARMLWDLRRLDITGFNVFTVPQTRALAEQKVQTMTSSEQWLWDLVDSAYEGLDLHNGYEATGDELEAHMDDFFRRKRFKPSYDSIRMHMGRLIQRMLPGTRRVRVNVGEERKWGYALPSPSDALAMLQKKAGLNV